MLQKELCRLCAERDKGGCPDHASPAKACERNSEGQVAKHILSDVDPIEREPLKSNIRRPTPLNRNSGSRQDQEDDNRPDVDLGPGSLADHSIH
jgi:hypothetical protein